jgi:hypothetical protein
VGVVAGRRAPAGDDRALESAHGRGTARSRSQRTHRPRRAAAFAGIEGRCGFPALLRLSRRRVRVALARPAGRAIT